jgi:WD40 repeat protein/predicted Ser/Thr protein kinase
MTDSGTAGSGGPERSDLRALVRSDTLSPAELVEALCADMVERWGQGERVPAEAYLALHPSLQGDAREAFELVYTEFALREQSGESPTLNEYLWRFPRFAERLQRQFGLHRQLLSDHPAPGAEEGPGRDRTRHGTEDPNGSFVLPSTALVPVPGYEVLGELGRGGMGVVYEARQKSLNRVVALKVIRDSVLAGPEEVRRFHREAEVAAGLQHPHIVQIYEVGRWEGYSYLALECLAGGTLARRLAGNPQEPRRAAELVATLARAMHHAHEHGVVHRDLKPANVLLTEDGAPKITDFGLAKRLDTASGDTKSGDVLGTPSYMAPEQAAGKNSAVDARTDVYALGAVLYEMLTGRPPFKGANVLATLSQAIARDPLAPSRLQPGIPRDLDTVCLKCLHKEPARRYQTAAALAEDLDRFLGGSPVLARPTPAWERAWKWAKRRPVIAGLAAALVLVTALGFGLTVWQWRRAEGRADAERRARQDAQDNERREQQARREVERLSAGALLDQGASVCAQGEVDRGLLLLARGLEVAARAQAPELERVARLDLAAWRQQLVRRHAQFHHTSIIPAAVFSPDGKTVLTCSHDLTARLWDADTGKPIGEPLRHEHAVQSIAFSPDGRYVLTGTCSVKQVAARLWDARTGRPAGPDLPHEDLVSAVAFSPQGELFLTVSPKQAQVWKTATCAPQGPPLRHAGAAVLTAAFSPDGKTVVTGGSDKTARLWEAATGRQRGQPLPHQGAVLVAAFSPDGKTLATGGADNLGRLWEADTGKPKGLPMIHRGLVQAVAFSQDGQRLVTGSMVLELDLEAKAVKPVGGEARVWSATGRPLLRPLAHPNPVRAVALSPDARVLLTGCEDGCARFYHVDSGQPIGLPLEHEGTVLTAAFRRDGRAALTASAGGDRNASARLWDLPPHPDTGTTLHLTESPTTVLIFSPDGKTLLTGHLHGNACFWDVTDAARGVRETGPRLQHKGTVTGVRFSPDGRAVLTVAGPRVVRLWDRDGGRLRHTWEQAGDVRSVAFSPDGREILIGTADGAVGFWDAAGGQQRGPALQDSKGVMGTSYAADGLTVWAAAGDNTVRQWDRATGRLLHAWPTAAPVGSATFHAGGRAALVQPGGRYVQLLDLAALAPGSGAGGKPESGPLLAHPVGAIQSLAFSADGSLLASVGSDQTVRLWDAPTGKQLGPALPHALGFPQVALRPDGRVLVFSGAGGTRLWELPAPVDGSPHEVRLWVEQLTGLGLDDQGTVHALSAAEVAERRRQSQGSGPPATAAP